MESVMKKRVNPSVMKDILPRIVLYSVMQQQLALEMESAIKRDNASVKKITYWRIVLYSAMLT